MAVKDTNMLPSAKTPLKCVTLLLGTTATGQTDKKTDGTIPGFAFQVERVEVNALTVTATIAVQVKIGTTSVLASAITPVAATPTAGTLATALASRRGTNAEAINVEYTSNGSGEATNGIVRVWIRPLPLNGEVYSV